MSSIQYIKRENGIVSPVYNPVHSPVFRSVTEQGRGAPLSIEDMTWHALYDQDSSVWQNTNATTAAVATGDDIQRWNDRSGNDRFLAKSTTSATPELLNAGTDRLVRFTQSELDILRHNLSVTVSNPSFSMHALVRPWSLSGNVNRFSIANCTNASNGGRMYSREQPDGRFVSNTVKSNSLWFGDSRDLYLFSAVRDGATVRHYLDGVLIYESNFAESPIFTHVFLGGFSSRGGNHDFGAFGLSFDAHSIEEIKAIKRHYHSSFSTVYPAKTDVGVIWVTNSYGTEDFCGIGNGLVAKVHATETPSVTKSWNQGVGGKTTTQMIADYQARSLPFGQQCEQAVFVLWEFVNDMLGGGRTAEQAIANMYALADGIKSANANYKVLVGTMIDHPVLSRTAIDAVNAELIANHAEHADGLIDLTSVAEISGEGANVTGTYFATNHPTAAGNDLIKGIFGAAIEAVLD